MTSKADTIEGGKEGAGPPPTPPSGARTFSVKYHIGQGATTQCRECGNIWQAFNRRWAIDKANLRRRIKYSHAHS